MMEMKNDLMICWDVRGVEIIAWMVLPLTKIGNLEGKKMFWVGDVFFFLSSFGHVEFGMGV